MTKEKNQIENLPKTTAQVGMFYKCGLINTEDIQNKSTYADSMELKAFRKSFFENADEDDERRKPVHQMNSPRRHGLVYQNLPK